MLRKSLPQPNLKYKSVRVYPAQEPSTPQNNYPKITTIPKRPPISPYTTTPFVTIPNQKCERRSEFCAAYASKTTFRITPSQDLTTTPKT